MKKRQWRELAAKRQARIVELQLELRKAYRHSKRLHDYVVTYGGQVVDLQNEMQALKARGKPPG